MCQRITKGPFRRLRDESARPQIIWRSLGIPSLEAWCQLQLTLAAARARILHNHISISARSTDRLPKLVIIL